MNDFLTRVEKLSPKRLALLAYELQSRLDRVEADRSEPIAIVGMGCRFPGAPDVDSFWQLLDEGRDAITEVPPDRWDIDDFYDPNPDAPGRMATRWGGFLDRVDEFDAPFFGISRREAISMDPQQRLLLEVAWEALENAGQSPRALAGSATGVFVGMSTGDYYGMLRGRGLEAVDAYMATGTAHSVAAGRIAYVLGLHGPNFAIDTACSSSLVAIHLACQSLRARECRAALAGGVNLILAPDITVALSKSHMMAPDGRCKPFDEAADGFVRGEGCGVIVLKRLSDAQADGDTVLATIRGSAVNQDGRSSGITAPNGASQRAVIRAALTAARVAPADVGYIEAHGTGTSLGDPIEAHALAAEFGGRAADNPLTIGSVKANIGHLEASAGVAGLIKVVLSLQHHRVPPQLHFHAMNPHIEWGGTAVDIPVNGCEWHPRGVARIAGVSSFGFSGTNAHIVLEEAAVQERAEGEDDGRINVLTLSARDESGLRALIQEYAASSLDPRTTLGDVCYTASTGRSHFTERAAFVATSVEELRAALLAAPTVSGSAQDRPKVAFLFTGQGAQAPGMGRELYDAEPVFRAAMDECAGLLGDALECSLLDVIYGERGALLDETQYTQPALFALEWSLAKLWESWGIKPSAVLGHSVGEYAALCVAGVWTLEDGLRIIAERGRLMQQLGGGWGMTAAQCPLAQVEDAIRSVGGSLSIAAVNAPESVVVSGLLSELGSFEDSITASGGRTRRLKVSHAFHSPQMDEVATQFAHYMKSVTFSEPEATIISSVTGRSVGVDQLSDPDYWRRQVRDSVQFQSAMETLAATHELFLEVGPSVTLLGMGRESVGRYGQAWVPSLRRDRSDCRQMLESLGQLYVKGVDINWAAFHAGHGRKRVALPTYPFQRQRYWPDSTTASAGSVGMSRVSGHSMLQGRVAAAVPIYQAHLSTEAFPYLADHRVAGSPVLPGAVFVELALAAASDAFGRADIALTDVHFREPLHVGVEPHAVQVVLTPDGHERARFQILSMPSAVSDAPWTLHVTGALSQSHPTSHANLDQLRGKFKTEIAPADFYDALSALGIDLGVHCRGIRALWRADGEVLAQISLDPSLHEDSNAYGFHPLVLDACLQSFGAALWLNNETGSTRVLTRIADLEIFGASSSHVWCHASIADVANGTGSITIFNESGKLLAEATGLQTTAVGAMSAESSVQPVDDWFYQVDWIPEPTRGRLHAGDILTGGQLARLLCSRASDLFTEHHLERYEELQPELDALASAYIVRALELMECDLTPGAHFDAEDLFRSAGVTDDHRSLFSRIIDILVEDGFLRRDVAGTVEAIAKPASDPDALSRELIARYPEFSAELELTARCATALAGVLQGRSDPLQLLFPGGSVSQLESLYAKSPSAHVFNPLVLRAVEAAVESAPSGRVVRILEIGAGTGGTTAFVVPALPADRVEYTFTDVSPLFLARAEERFGEYPFMRYEVLDIGESNASLEQYDVVIAANVLHATAHLRQTLEHVRQRVAPGGLLVLLEGTRPERWVDLTFGMTGGWWAFEDHDLRPHYALVDAPTWLRLLSEQGFEDVAAIAPRQGAQQVVLVARAAADRDVGRWLIAPDANGAALELARHVAERGGTVVLRDTNTDISNEAYDYVVDMSALDLVSPADVASFAACEQAALDLLDTMRSTVRSTGSPRIWIVTRGAQPTATTSEMSVATMPMQATFWGIGRTFALEQPDAWGGICDLDPDASDATAVSSLLDLVLNAAGEDQFAIRGDVAYVPRIARRAAPPSEVPVLSPHGKYLITGGLGNIGLRAAEWLVEHGAREIVLNSRSGLPDRSDWDTLDPGSTPFHRVAAVRNLEARGASVSILVADVAAPDAGSTLLDTFAPGDLRGILHAAAVFGSQTIDSLSAGDFDSVMRPKMLGAIAVGELARTTGVDFLVMFSSTTSLLGSSGMAAYAAANQFLDAFAHELRTEGVPALTVNWGTWDELGDVTEEGRKNYIRAGLHPMPSSDALSALARMLGTDEAQVTIAQIDWTSLKSLYETRRRRPILDRITNRQPAVSVELTAHAPTDIFVTLSALTEAERGRRLADIVRTEAASVLALGPDEVDPQLGLFEMGMDSLMSVELRARLERRLSRKLPSTLTFNYPNVNALAGYLGGLIVVEPPVSAPDHTPASVPSVLLDNVDSDALSEDEIAAMLSNALQSLD